MIFHCLFEQSGTFKNEFKKLGYEAYDYDILNDFGETDYQIDLFKEIEEAYERERDDLRPNRRRRSDPGILSLRTIRESDHALVQRTVQADEELGHGTEDEIRHEADGRTSPKLYAGEQTVYCLYAQKPEADHGKSIQRRAFPQKILVSQTGNHRQGSERSRRLFHETDTVLVH